MTATWPCATSLPPSPPRCSLRSAADAADINVMLIRCARTSYRRNRCRRLSAPTATPSTQSTAHPAALVPTLQRRRVGRPLPDRRQEHRRADQAGQDRAAAASTSPAPASASPCARARRIPTSRRRRHSSARCSRQRQSATPTRRAAGITGAPIMAAFQKLGIAEQIAPKIQARSRRTERPRQHAGRERRGRDRHADGVGAS